MGAEAQAEAARLWQAESVGPRILPAAGNATELSEKLRIDREK